MGLKGPFVVSCMELGSMYMTGALTPRLMLRPLRMNLLRKGLCISLPSALWISWVVSQGSYLLLIAHGQDPLISLLPPPNSKVLVCFLGGSVMSASRVVLHTPGAGLHNPTKSPGKGDPMTLDTSCLPGE